ncbi:MAG TPA: MFS transporter [Prolixibacteraceae bacterium]|mgnify:CR=1 FL=1|nr:MFS transporter [Prolixibacteraceae bacterium]
MENPTFKVYSYRWVMLAIYMFIVAMNQLSWITFAPITSDAATYYKVSELSIGILSMSFMVIFIIFSIPASWIIDTYGIRIGVGIGALLTGVFGLMRGFAASDFTLLLISQIGIAIGQPFLLNAITKLSARWFPMKERATASGLGTLSMYIGILGGMIITPFVTLKSGIDGMLYIYGVISVVAAVIFLVFSKERPKTAPCLPGEEERALVLDGFKIIFRSKDFLWMMVIFFIGLGVFNSVTTWIEGILSPRNFTITQAGIVGGVMIAAGIIGALVIPILSDMRAKRVPFIRLALLGSTIGLIGLTYSSSYAVVLIAGATLGFFLLSSGPIGFQYGAEVTYPASEGSSNGLLLMMGQVSGIAFIFGMDFFKSKADGSMNNPLLIMILLMVVSLIVSFKLKESKMVGK